MSDDKLTGSCYLTLEPQYRDKRLGPKRLVGFEVTKVTKNKPRTSKAANSRVVEVELSVHRSSFEPVVAQVDIPEGATEAVVGIESVAQPEGVSDE